MTELTSQKQAALEAIAAATTLDALEEPNELIFIEVNTFVFEIHG